jgi:hypothetical protein
MLIGQRVTDIGYFAEVATAGNACGVLVSPQPPPEANGSKAIVVLRGPSCQHNNHS